MLTLLLLVSSAAAASLGNSSDNNVTKREVLEFYPDWVPFKNKHGDDLGEFVEVPKAKVKKRLAPPVNFILRAVAEPEGDDYYEKGQGESDGDEYFEKKDWSDLNRPEQHADSVEPTKIANLSDIDGVLDILTQERPSLADAINNARPLRRDDESKEVKDKPETEKENDTETKEKPTTKKPHKYEDDVDYEESEQQPAEKRRPEISEEERLENEAKKKIILDSVDELKERHAEEQRAISEKVKEEEFNKEMFERDQIQVKKQRDKYADRSYKRRNKPTPPDYEEYDERGSWRDKYNVKVEKTTTTAPTTKRTTRGKTKHIEQGKLSVFRNPNLYMILDDNESAERTVPTTKRYEIPKPPRRFSSKYTLTTTERPLLAAESISSVPEVPKPSEPKEAEPVLFFPKIKNKRKRKLKTTTTAPDSFVAETMEDKAAKKLTTKGLDIITEVTAPETTEDYKTTALANDDYQSTSTSDIFKTTARGNEKYKSTRPDTTGTDTTGPDTTGTDTTGQDSTAPDTTATGPSADAESTNSDTVTDAVPASSDHKKEEPKDYHVEKGGGSEHHSSHEEEHEEHGKKAYEANKPSRPHPRIAKILKNDFMNDLDQKPWYYCYDIEGLHKDSHSKKGHHDKEDHLGKYEDHGGFDKKHHDEKEHYGAHHHEEHGKKHAKYEESGKHSKGHSTKGSHDIHKKEEYEKNVEFFEEEGDSAEQEKHGGYNSEKEHKSGGKYKKGNLDAAHHEHKKGESGHFEKGGHHAVHKGHKSSGGHDGHGKHGKASHANGGQQAGKKWIYHHGYPAKNSNLVIIDRRTDRYVHGPSYYG